jgi:thioester reductase-like protein
MATIFFTGFPGFLGSELLPRVLARRPADVALCLVQPRFAPLARARADQLVAQRPELAGRIRLVEGDLTQPGLGLPDAAAAAADVAEVYHLAAVYDLTVKREVGLAVNVEGTRQVLDFARRCGRLERLQYVSTCYVSGRHDGLFLESDLEKGQAFNNFYEETKYLAEVQVRAAMAAGLPTTVYRPAITVGDSRTGATRKFDGPYYILQWLLRQASVAVMPVVGDLTCEVNVVPSDFVIGAIDALAGRPASVGQTYQLADPRPLQVGAKLDHMAKATGRTVVRVPLTVGLAKLALDRVPGVSRLMRIPSAAIDYFVQPTRYDVRHASADLEGTGVACPPFPSYLPRLVEFWKAHPEITAGAMA